MFRILFRGPLIECCTYIHHCSSFIQGSVHWNYRFTLPKTFLHKSLSLALSYGGQWLVILRLTPIHLSLGRPRVFLLVPILGFPVTVCFLTFCLRVQNITPFFCTSHIFLPTSVCEIVGINKMPCCYWLSWRFWPKTDGSHTALKLLVSTPLSQLEGRLQRDQLVLAC